MISMEPLPANPARGGPYQRAGEPTERVIVVRRDGDMRMIATVGYDPVAQLIRAHAAGEWSLAEAERYLAALTAHVEAARALDGKARILLDRRDVTTQSAAVAALLAKANGAIFRPDDKIALVVGSSLAKVGLRQRLPHPGSNAFLSIEAAETWLGAFAR